MTEISRAELTMSRSLRALAIAQIQARRSAPARPLHLVRTVSVRKSSETLALSGRSGRLDPRASAQSVACRSAGLAGLLKGGEERPDTVRRRRTPALLRRSRGSTFDQMVEAVGIEPTSAVA